MSVQLQVLSQAHELQELLRQRKEELKTLETEIRASIAGLSMHGNVPESELDSAANNEKNTHVNSPMDNPTSLGDGVTASQTDSNLGNPSSDSWLAHALNTSVLRQFSGYFVTRIL